MSNNTTADSGNPQQQTQRDPAKGGPKQIGGGGDGRRSNPEDGARSSRANKKNSGYFVRDSKVGAYG